MKYKSGTAVLAGGLLIGSALTAGSAAAIDPQEVTMPEVSMECYGKEKFSKRPLVQLTGSQVSYAFEDTANCSTVRKVTKATIKTTGEPGDVIKAQGYRCKLKKVTPTQPTGGDNKWKCVFKAADTPTKIVLKYTQFLD